jgi:hypothetical protein
MLTYDEFRQIKRTEVNLIKKTLKEPKKGWVEELILEVLKDSTILEKGLDTVNGERLLTFLFLESYQLGIFDELVELLEKRIKQRHNALLHEFNLVYSWLIKTCEIKINQIK